MSRDIPDRSLRLSTYPSDNETLSLPKKSGTKRRHVSQQWDRQFSDLTQDDLENKRKKIGKELSEARANMKRQVSMDAEYWERYEQVANLSREDAQIESQRGLEAVLNEQKEASEWYESEDGERYQLKYSVWNQISNTIQRQRQRMVDRKGTPREGWVKLFISSKLGMGLATKDTGVGPRDTSDQSNFKQALIDAYIPRRKRPIRKVLWDPVIGDWFQTLQGAHLFPYSQGIFMDDIFGKGSQKELFSYKNGLLLHEDIKKALENGFVAIVPDIDLEPASPRLPLNDKEERDQRIRAWQKAKPKEYKFIVLNKKNPAVTEEFPLPAYGVPNIAALDGKRLQFLTSKRPRARYIWWTYLNAIVRNSWSQKLTEVNLQHQEVQKRTLYGSYIKKNQLLGFIEEIGHEVGDALEFDSEEEVSDEPRLEGIGAMVGRHLVEWHKEEEANWVTDDEQEGKKICGWKT
ncbi:hypothetical protein FVEN_g7671 [Fusarium venenatum]|uniref:HNH nuclease domain-containing protein n=1 Tax=Fusarium venenatum TaxID=56646 RepID=A0A2L2TZX2_9HYPO|nr:uncharacterized protein FVRRES_08137 [Fusarium venenatum]KAG8354241.1 hypothetical protein FVEN_g7671 [Fusarium venenatum]CEI68060.1 unnamed protein product [Fusarium venenatum]